MFLIEPPRTQFDLHFRIFGIPVRVHPFFWLLSALLGSSALEQGFQFLLLWVLCVFISILVHEMGHVLIGRLFGSSGRIVLYSFGGLAIGSSALPSRWQRILVYFAGPLAGFILFGLVLGGLLLGVKPALLWHGLVHGGGLLLPRELSPLVVEASFDLLEINLVWGILNLFPIWPLDGGKISQDFLEWLMPRSGTVVSLWISIVAAALLAVPFFYLKAYFTALFFAWMAFNSYQALQQVRSVRREDTWGRAGAWDKDRPTWEDDPDSWKS